jgi:hypothetical protein
VTLSQALKLHDEGPFASTIAATGKTSECGVSMIGRRRRMPETFEEMIERERERLTKAHEDALARRKQIDEEIGAIDREFEAIEAYERAKAGKPPKGAATSEKPSRQRARRGERNQQLLELIGHHSDGLTRSEILMELGVKGDKKAEASVSNTLNNMKKSGELWLDKKRYAVPE